MDERRQCWSCLQQIEVIVIRLIAIIAKRSVSWRLGHRWTIVVGISESEWILSSRIKYRRIVNRCSRCRYRQRHPSDSDRDRDRMSLEILRENSKEMVENLGRSWR